MDNLKAFGAGMSGGAFDHKTFLRKPSVLCRIGAAVLGAGLWFCMYKGGWHRELININQQMCLFNGSATTCSFVSAMGFFSLLAALALLAADAQFDKISAIQTRSRVVRADMATSSFFAFIFVLMFINTLSKFKAMELYEPHDSRWVKMVILFSFLAAGAWAGAAFLAWRRWQASQAEAPFQQNEYQTDFQGVSGDVAEGYGYGGNDEGIGAVAGATAYQSGAPMQQQQQMQQQHAQHVQQNQYQQQQQQQHYQQQHMPHVPASNPFAGQQGYQY
ncbi:hypothetical protein PENTCL1PPCAC_28863 [Pristionchus entomophagus]|uniref:MARVEL domain-containing protein n=1 Tax=Pristionchus entomophagus TaxID=358040 RepID=A0AAV5UJZ6_9BILA|nr:hypothetical protein PENTCL1PPCAC_28863 [Pristionchus entomophagus]